MERWLWCSSAIFFLSSLFVTCNGDFSTGAIQAIRCTLFRTAAEDCASIPEVSVPSYLVAVYNDSPSSLHNALRSGQLSLLSDAQVASLPLALLYLIPRSRLVDMNGTQLGIIVQKHREDTALARQLTSTLQSTRQRLQLLYKLKASDLPEDVVQVVGEGLKLSDLRDGFFEVLPELDEPFLAYLRPADYLRLNTNTLYKINFLLNKLEPSRIPRKPMIRVIAQASVRHNFPLSKVYWLQSGLTADELKNESLTHKLDTKSLKLDLDSMQARAVFDRLYQNRQLHQGDYIDSMPVLTKLTPTLLQRFPVQEHKYDTINSLPLPHSLPTAVQLTQEVKAECRRTGKLPSDDGQGWESHIHYMGQWVYTLSLDSLREYLHSPLTTAWLRSVQSSALSPVQAYYLTGRGEVLNVGAANSLVDLDTMLHALPASQLVSRGAGDISSTVLQHLAAHLPADNTPRTLALVNKIAPVLDQPFILENLLKNPELNSILSLVSPKDLRVAGMSFIHWSLTNPESSEKICQMPQPILAALLEKVREELRDSWGWRLLLEKKQVRQLLGALNCEHISQIDTGLFVPILALYNRQRHQIFPKNLQQCCLRKLMEHLQLKMTLTQTDPELGLISVLEPVEIESLGGSVLAGLPVEALRKSLHLDHILATIGRLSNAELLSAINTTHLRSIAQLTVKQGGIVDVFTAGNLVWFLPPNTKVPELRLALEAKLLDTTVCMSAASRRSLAAILLAQFGPTDSWSGGVLATLRDLLVVFPQEQLATVSQAAWTEAADCLQSHFADDIHPDLGPRRPFYQFCLETLGEAEGAEWMSAVRVLTRQYLTAAQWLLNTVSDPSIDSGKPSGFVFPSHEWLDPHPATPVGVFSPETHTDTSTSEESTTESTTEEASTTTETHLRTSPRSTFDLSVANSPKTTTQKSLSTVKSPETTSSSASKSEPGLPNRIPSSSPKEETLHRTSSVGPPVEPEHNQTEDETKGSKNKKISSTEKIPLKINNAEADSNNVQDKDSTGLEQNGKLDFVPLEGGPHHTKPNDTSEMEPQQHNNNKSEAIGESDHSSNTTSGLTNDRKELIYHGSHESNHTFSESSHVVAEKSDHSATPHDAHNPNSDLTEEDEEESVYYEPEENKDTILGSSSVVTEATGPSDSKLRRKRNTELSVQLSCHAVKMIGRQAGLVISERDLEEMSNSDIEDCKVEFGAMTLTLELRKLIWKKIYYMDGLHLLGNLLQAISVADLWDLQFSANSSWVLETVHALTSHYNITNNTVVMRKLLEVVTAQNPEPSPELSAALGPLVCGLGGEGPPPTCPACLPRLALEAVQRLGPVTEWSQHHVHWLEVVVAGLELDSWRLLIDSPHKPLAALQPAAIKCLNASHLEVLKPEHIETIPTLTLLSLSQQQLEAFGPEKLQAFQSATRFSAPKNLLSVKKSVYYVAGVPSRASHNDFSSASTFFVLFCASLVLKCFRVV